MFGKKRKYDVTVTEKPHPIVEFIKNVLIVLFCGTFAIGMFMGLIS